MRKLSGNKESYIYLLASKGVSPISRIIRWRQWGYPYTHIAWIGAEFPKDPADPYVIEAWDEGVVAGRISERHTPGTEFSIFSVPAAKEQAKLADEFINGKIGTPYDWAGIFGFLAFSKKLQSKKRYFCSELVFENLQKVGINLLNNTEPAEVSPRLFLKSPLLNFIGTFKIAK